MYLSKAAVLVAALMLGSSLAVAQEARLWIATGTDIAALAQQSFAGRALLSDGRPAFQTFETSNGIAVAEIAESALDEFIAMIHQNFLRCGGFTVHPSRAAAVGEANNPAYAPGFRAPAGIFPVAIDQHSTVNAALPLVSAPEILGTIRALQNIGTRYYQSQKGQDAANLIAQRWQSLGSGRSDFSVARFQHGGWTQDSVVATIRGADLPDEIVVIGAHLDSINRQNNNDAPGADDDGSGVAVVTEALRVLTRMNFKPKRTIQFMAYAAEEVGLRGSGEIADRYKQQGKNVVAALQMDMTGYAGSARNVYFVTDFVNADLTAFMKQLIQAYNTTGAHRITYDDTRCGYACSDHSSWTRNGIPSAFPFESAFADYNRAIHSANDTLAHSDATGAHQTRFAKLGVEFLIEIAKNAGRAPPPPARYVYTTLRIISNQNPRGCGASDWACMTRLCQQDLGAAASRGWAGCQKKGSSFLCNFECVAVRAFQ